MTAADTLVDLHVEVKRCPECGTGFGVEASFCPFDGIALKSGTWDPTRDPLTNTVVDKRYEVVEALGEGGMGTVYRVRHVTLDRMFAMKVLRRDLAADAELAARFLQEAKATAAVRHPSVVGITDFGELDDGAPYFIMELLVGETLASRLRTFGALSAPQAIGIARKVADALAAAHAAGVVHRDVKPDNVFLLGPRGAAREELRVVDFGAAKIIGASRLTRPGVVFGTPYYMSPEQASGQPVDARADVYSLGVLLYEMVTGAVPFEADTYMGVLTKHMFEGPMKPSERAAGVALGALDGVVMRALEKDPGARYQSMTELLHALDVAGDPGVLDAPLSGARSARPVAFPELSAADRIQRSVSRHVDGERGRKRRTIVFASVAAAAALCACALTVSFLSASRSPRSAPASAPAPPPALTIASASASVSPVPVPVPVPVSVSASTPAPAPAAPPAAPAAPAERRPPTVRRPSGARPSDDLVDPWRR